MTFFMGPHMLSHPAKSKMKARVYSLGFATRAPFQLLMQSQEGLIGTQKGIASDLARITPPSYS